MTRTAETKLIMRRELDALRTINTYGLQQLHQIPHGEIIQCRFRFDRSIKHNAFYWSLISMVWENLNHLTYPRVESFHAALKVLMGEREEIYLPARAELVMETGEVIRVTEAIRTFMPGSTAFGNMSQDRFKAYVDRVIDLIIAHWLPTVKRRELVSAVLTMIGGPQAREWEWLLAA